jgi:hypothetical protein
MAGAFDIKLDTESHSAASGGTWNQGDFIVGNAGAVSKSTDVGGVKVPNWVWWVGVASVLFYAKKQKVF